jgi:hypothetical protein
MKDLPVEWHERAKALIEKHAARGWKDIRIGVPDAQSSPNRLMVHATSPSGVHKHYPISEDEAGFADLDRFFDSG